VLMNQADLVATGVIKPGSRSRYHLLLAVSPQQLADYLANLQPSLSTHQRVIDIGSAQRGLASALQTGSRYLLLAGVIGVLLAAVAIVIAARRFAERHVDQVALMKSLGASSWQIRRLYLVQLILLALVAVAVGLAIGDVLQRLVAAGLQSYYPITMAAASPNDYWIGVFSGVVCLLFFTLPPLWHLPLVPPIKILRREMAIESLQQSVRLGWGLLALLILVAVFCRDLWLTLSVIAGLLMLIALATAGAYLLLRFSRVLGQRRGRVLRFALAGLHRYPGRTLMQVVVFATAMMLLLSLSSVRGSLLDEWRWQLPEKTPNHFLLNIAPHEVDSLNRQLTDNTIPRAQLYPLVRARLLKINGDAPSPEAHARAEVLKREANLSWSDTLSEDNRIVSGFWWDRWGGATNGQAPIGVSVEEELARDLSLQLGDQLEFSVGGLKLMATVASFRSLEWDSMRPNFYFLFSPGALDNFSPTYLTSIYLGPDNKRFINRLLREFPTVVVIEMDKVIAQIRQIVGHVSEGVELVLWLVLATGGLVLLAAVHAGIDERMGEVGLMRALGSSRRLLMGSLWLEFSALGAMSGILAAVASEALLMGLQHWVLDIPLSLHYELWLAGPVLGALLIGFGGVVSSFRVINTAPMVVIREQS
jgi:putative ABC transport system permease protein